MFVYYFPRLGLFISAATSIIGALTFVMSLLIPTQGQTDDPARSALASFVVQHASLYAGLFTLTSFIALAASWGFLHHQRWALRAWSALCYMGLAWAVTCIAFELHQWLYGTGSQAMSTGLGLWAGAWTFTVVLSSLMGAVVFVLLLRQLSGESTKLYFQAVTR